MEKLTLNLKENSYDIYVGEDIVKYNLKKFIENSSYFFVIDKLLYDKYYDLYFDFLDGISNRYIFLLNAYEKNKTIDKTMEIIGCMVKANIGRESTLICIGGGITGDICGFVASIYMRGISLIYVPTTLLSQVDSSIGGKNALNLYNGKNLIGTFKQPKEVIIDIKFLKTLNNREFLCGLAEVVKYGIIGKNILLETINDEFEKLLHRDFELLKQVIIMSCKIKLGIVEKDEKDNSLRKVLNHGHTIGHAIESVTNYDIYNHGESVIIGIFYEFFMAYKLELIDRDYFGYLKNIFNKFNIIFNFETLDKERFYEALLKDKKNSRGKISFIFPVSKGKVKEYLLTLDEVKSLMTLFS